MSEQQSNRIVQQVSAVMTKLQETVQDLVGDDDYISALKSMLLSMRERLDKRVEDLPPATEVPLVVVYSAIATAKGAIEAVKLAAASRQEQAAATLDEATRQAQERLSSIRSEVEGVAANLLREGAEEDGADSEQPGAAAVAALPAWLRSTKARSMMRATVGALRHLHSTVMSRWAGVRDTLSPTAAQLRVAALQAEAEAIATLSLDTVTAWLGKYVDLDEDAAEGAEPAAAAAASKEAGEEAAARALHVSAQRLVGVSYSLLSTAMGRCEEALTSLSQLDSQQVKSAAAGKAHAMAVSALSCAGQVASHLATRVATPIGKIDSSVGVVSTVASLSCTTRLSRALQRVWSLEPVQSVWGKVKAADDAVSGGLLQRLTAEAEGVWEATTTAYTTAAQEGVRSKEE
jgi:hypothetical protein